eukprot:TRINITY_DN1089_c4_g1_i1.p1 TRINITY_DN1089_c4_g1~~TRINITY_DN1089_c4_g1_i1.p1  ORF type:complete len:279 (+),score=65.42 TRINITY_DN1089_c4_g1_i1:48-884(+)
MAVAVWGQTDDLLNVNFVKDLKKKDGMEKEILDEQMSLADVKIPICPKPSSIPTLKLNKGTTTLGFQYNGGVIIAVDSRASTGQYIASSTTMKVIEINNYMLGTMAGGAADCQFWHRVVGQECRLWELRNNQRITIAAASKIMWNILYQYRNHGLSVGTMVAGWGSQGPSLYMMDDSGTRLKGNLFSVGSGSIYAYGVLDADYREDLTDEEAIALGRRAILHATHRDAGSGGAIQVYRIHKPDENGNSWTKELREDCMSLWEKAQADKSMAKHGPLDP